VVTREVEQKDCCPGLFKKLSHTKLRMLGIYKQEKRLPNMPSKKGGGEQSPKMVLAEKEETQSCIDHLFLLPRRGESVCTEK